MLGLLSFVALPISVSAAVTYTATYTPQDAPPQSEQGQAGTNACGTGYNQTSQCQNAYLNSVTDFCLFAPPEPGAGSVIGETERIEVSWCMQGNYGTRIIPDGAIQGAHFVQTPDFVQITGWGDLTKLNIPAGDAGGELDPHGADGNGNPIGGLVFSSAFSGTVTQLHEWTNFMSATEFCFRGCVDGPNAPMWCEHIYDLLGCDWNMPGNYSVGSFDNCKGDSGEPMGVYGGSTFFQGEPVTPPPHPAPATSSCTSFSTISNALNAASTAAGNPSASPTSTHPPSASGSAGASATGASRTGSSSATPTGSSASTNAAAGSTVPGVLVAAAMIAAFLGL